MIRIYKNKTKEFFTIILNNSNQKFKFYLILF